MVNNKNCSDNLIFLTKTNYDPFLIKYGGCCIIDLSILMWKIHFKCVLYCNSRLFLLYRVGYSIKAGFYCSGDFNVEATIS